MYFWAIYHVYNALTDYVNNTTGMATQNVSWAFDLRADYLAILTDLQSNIGKIFYAGNGTVRGIAVVNTPSSSYSSYSTKEYVVDKTVLKFCGDRRSPITTEFQHSFIYNLLFLVLIIYWIQTKGNY